MYNFHKLSPNYSIIFLPLDEQESVGGLQSVRSLSTQPGAPSHVTVGDGVTPATFPEQLYSKRGELFDGGNYIDLNWAPGGVLDTQTFTVCALVRAERPVADGRIYEIGIAGQRYSLYYDLSADEIVWMKDGGIPQTLTSSYGASYGQVFSVVASISSTSMRLWVNGRLVGSIVGDVRLSGFDAATEAYFGQDVAGGNRYKGRIYTSAIYPFELAFSQVREWDRIARQLRTTGIEWTPAALLAGASAGWYWTKGDGLTFNTQPTIANADFSAWTGDNPNNWSVSPEDATHYITEDPNGARIVTTDGSYIGMTQVSLIGGNYYRLIFDVASVTSGGVNTDTLYASIVNTEGVSTREGTALAAALSLKRHSGVTDVVLRSIAAENLSLTEVAPTAAVGTLAGSVLEQADPTRMPWSDGGSIRFAGATADQATHNVAAAVMKFLHDGTGGTLAFKANLATVTGTWNMVSDMAAGTDPGVSLLYSAGQVRLRMGDGAGGYVAAANGVIAAGERVVVLRVGPAAFDARIGGASFGSGAITPAAANPTQALTWGNGMDGAIEDALLVSRYLTDPEVARLEAYWS